MLLQHSQAETKERFADSYIAVGSHVFLVTGVLEHWRSAIASFLIWAVVNNKHQPNTLLAFWEGTEHISGKNEVLRRRILGGK